MNEPSPQKWIVTGARETGKTRFCTHLVDRARREGVDDIAGLLSPPVYENGVKTAIEVEDLRTGECRILAHSRRDEKANVQTKRWSFDTEVLKWGDNLLANATPCDILVVDELGLLEFERGGGWQNGLTAIQSGRFRLAVVVIRPELINKASVVFGKARVLEIPPHQDASRERDMIDLILDSITSPYTPT